MDRLQTQWAESVVPASVWVPVLGAEVITLLCGGDLPSLVVDLEEGHVLFVGDLADQGVVEVSVGGRGVVLIHGKNTDNWRTWDDTRT